VRLSLLLHRTPGELAATLGVNELAELEAFEALFGLPDVFTLVGLLGPLMANLWRGKRGKIARAADFLPYYRSAGGRMTMADIRDFFRSAAARGRGGR
jgi:hypothetical protein